MSEYIRRSDGPGSIGGLLPGAALWHPPTIGSNDPFRNIGSVTRGAGPVPSLGGCQGCGFGTNGNGNNNEAGMMQNLPSWAIPVGALALLGGAYWWLKRSKAREEAMSEAAFLGY
jgi:hypothetical protein